MKLESRLTILFAALIAFFLGALSILHWAQKKSAFGLQQTIAEDKVRQLQRIITLSGKPLERFVADYTQWDDMCSFVSSADPIWAEINIAQSLGSWDFQAAWVIAADGHEVYRHLRPPFRAGELADFPSAALRDYLSTPQSLQFFADSPQGLLEIRTAPIHPSDDARMEEPPQGWFIAAKLWSSATFAQLGSLIDSDLSLGPGSPGPGEASASIGAAIPLPDWHGTPLHHLVLQHRSELLANMISYDFDELILFLAFGIAALGLAAWFVNTWVRRPIQLIQTSLAQDRPEVAASLTRNRDEFAHIATLIRTASEQRLALRREVEDRTFAEQELRHAIAERTALGRDLHDGVIQSIYAVGMTLQGIGPLLEGDSREAQQRLSSCVDGLNRTIGQLRNHIAGLEPEPTPAASLADGLQKLIKELREARDVAYSLQIDPLLDHALPPDAIIQLLFIAREAISNALRHSEATRIGIRLNTAHGEPTFIIEDDGAGFDTGSANHRGHGLDNMTRRAEEIGAALTIDSIPGRGTRLTVELPWSTLAANPRSEPRPST